MKILVKDPVTGRTSAIEAVPGIPSGGDVRADGTIAKMQGTVVDLTTTPPVNGQALVFATSGGTQKIVPGSVASGMGGIYEYDFLAMASHNFLTVPDTTWTDPVDRVWTVRNTVHATSFEIIHGQGLVIHPDSESNYYDGANTMPGLWLPLGGLMVPGISWASGVSIQLLIADNMNALGYHPYQGTMFGLLRKDDGAALIAGRQARPGGGYVHSLKYPGEESNVPLGGTPFAGGAFNAWGFSVQNISNPPHTEQGAMTSVVLPTDGQLTAQNIPAPSITRPYWMYGTYGLEDGVGIFVGACGGTGGADYVTTISKMRITVRP